MLCPLSDCPLGLKGDLCCICCSKKETCPEACEKRNKSCAGIDKDEVYCKVTGETVTQDITTITRSQVRNLLEEQKESPYDNHHEIIRTKEI